MRTILLSFTIVFLSISAFSQKKQSDLEFEGLKGKVRSVESSTLYLGTKEKPQKSPKREYYRTEVYSLDGKLTEELHPDRGVNYVYEFVDGFLSMKEVVTDKRKANGFRTRSIGNAEDMENPVKSIKPDERYITRYDYEYDDNGRRKLRRIFFSDGKMDSITHYSYNAAGLLENEIYNTYGNKWSPFYSYDVDGNRKEQTIKRSNTYDVIDMIERTEYHDYKYDAEGNWTERKHKHHQEYNGSTKISESIEYREIKYFDADTPKKKAADNRKKK